MHRSANRWLVGDYPLALHKRPDGWTVVPLDNCGWLISAGLADQRFRTRRDALQAVLLALQLHPHLPARSAPFYRRLSSGEYQLEGNMRAVREKNIWRVLDHGRLTGSAPTLRSAALLARLRLDQSDVLAAASSMPRDTRSSDSDKA